MNFHNLDEIKFNQNGWKFKIYIKYKFSEVDEIWIFCWKLIKLLKVKIKIFFFQISNYIFLKSS